MARRLKDSQKKSLVEGYRLGESTSTLAEAFGCSQNTVIRIVKTSLPIEEYRVLKASRSKREGSHDSKLPYQSGAIENRKTLNEAEKVKKDQRIETNQDNADKDFVNLKNQEELENLVNIQGHVALNDDDKSRNVSREESACQQSANSNVKDFSYSSDVFHEVAPLDPTLDITQPKEVACESLSPGVLPSVVYMLIDRSVELDARPLKEFSELGVIPKADQDRKVICLFSNQRSAKRNCGRSQRVIKVPDSNVFGISKPFLLARGITRLLLDGTLLSLDT